jgi:methyl-accepting chemotaxis protein
MTNPMTPRLHILPVLLIGVLPVVLLLGLIIYQILIAQRLASSRFMVVHTFEVVSAAQALDAAIQDAERAQRGFLLTGEESYLAPYELGITVIPKSIGRLQSLTVDNPEQQARLVTLQSHLATKLDVLKRTIDARRAGNPDAALAIVRTNVGEISMRAIQVIIGDTIDAEKILLQRRLDMAAAAETNSSIAMLAGSALALLLLAAGGLVLRARLAGPRKGA